MTNPSIDQDNGADVTSGAGNAGSTAASVDKAVSVTGLRKRYGDRWAVDGVDLEIRVGECFGILGPNGAGKTTTIEMIEGLRQPDDGSITVLGQSPWPRNTDLLPRIGVQLQASSFIDKLTAREQLEIFAKLYGADGSRIDELLASVDLLAVAGTRADRLSGGQQQRLSTACALVGDPELIFLDEPSAGLDPSARRRLWKVIEDAKDQGRTVVLTTHYMEEAETLCDRVAIMDRGRVLAVDSPPGLVRGLDAPTRVVLPPGVVEVDSAVTFDGVEAVEVETGALVLLTHRPAAVIAVLADAGLLDGLQMRSASLEDAFLALTGRTLSDSDEGSRSNPSGQSVGQAESMRPDRGVDER